MSTIETSRISVCPLSARPHQSHLTYGRTLELLRPPLISTCRPSLRSWVEHSLTIDISRLDCLWQDTNVPVRNRRVIPVVLGSRNRLQRIFPGGRRRIQRNRI